MEHTPEQAAEGAVIVQVLSTVLDRLVCANATLARTDPGQNTKFHARKAPGIGILPYLERIHKYASCSNECFILALIYIDRLIQRNNFLLTELNVHRVIITAILLAAKFFDDAYYNNAYYSKVGGVLVSEMNGLEVDFLFRINFSLHVTPEIFQKYKAELQAHSVSQGIVTPVVPAAPVDPSSHFVVGGTVVPAAAVTPHSLALLPNTTTIVVPNPTQHHHLVHQVTPSPSHGTIPTLAPPVETEVSIAPNLYATDPSSLAFQQQQQQLLQRAHSLPPIPSQTIPTNCTMDAQQQQIQSQRTGCNSAPMVAMLPPVTSWEEQYIRAVASHTIYPLQSTRLVHHHHGANVVEQSYGTGGGGYPAPQDHHPHSLVAGAQY